MKTINEAAESEAKLKHGFDMEEEKYYQSNKVNVYEAFKNGVEFAQRWISVEEELPKETPDGLSELVLTINKLGIIKLEIYDHEFNRFSDVRYEFPVTHWRPIERS